MPLFDFQSDSGETISVYLTLNEPKESYQTQIKDGKVYRRIYTPFNVCKDTRSSDGTREDFQRMTEGKNLTMGDMFDKSKELSIKRAERNGGVDPVAERTYAKYQKKIGKKHPDVIKREKRAKLKEKFGVSISD